MPSLKPNRERGMAGCRVKKCHGLSKAITFLHKPWDICHIDTHIVVVSAYFFDLLTIFPIHKPFVFVWQCMSHHSQVHRLHHSTLDYAGWYSAFGAEECQATASSYKVSSTSLSLPWKNADSRTCVPPGTDICRYDRQLTYGWWVVYVQDRWGSRWDSHVSHITEIIIVITAVSTFNQEWYEGETEYKTHNLE